MIAKLALVAVVAILALYLVRWYRRREGKSEAKAARELADLAGMGELVAAGRYPKIDPDRCIGSGACVAACPEKGVLALVRGRGVLVNPLACVGHGLCYDACPVEAITLVYGSAKEARQLPRVDERHETNQPGMYIVGELGGMGLIRNAVAQGRTAAEAIAKSDRRGGGDVRDAIVVGAGPSGITATLGLKEAGLDVLMIDRDTFGGTILHYPRAKLVMTGTLDFPLYGRVRQSTMSKEALVALWADIDAKVGLPFQGNAMVEDVVLRDDGTWKVCSSAGELLAANVVLALGTRGSPRQLGVDGEELAKVAYGVLEPQEYAGQRMLVVGGGNSAVETAIALAEQGGCASVAISYRKASFARCRGDNRARIGELISAGKVRPLFETNVVAVREGLVTLRGADGGTEDIENDAVIVQIGGTPPTKLLSKFGVQLISKRGEE